MHFTDEITFSSSSLINTFIASYPDETKKFLQQFKKSYSLKNIIDYLRGLENIKVLVIGDIIIDEYHYCIGMGKTQKDNIIATRFVNNEIFAGGALAAANHIAGFSKNVTLLSVIGTKNDYTNFIVGH